jgi:broad specificity phosphatase PhoE
MIANSTTDYSLAPMKCSLDAIELDASTSQMTRIYFVRHGESIFNVPNINGCKVVSGIGLDVPLTEKGLQQAESLGKKLAVKLPIDGDYVILSSAAIRAQATADKIYAQLNVTHTIVRGQNYHEFCEQGKGDWEGEPKDAVYENAQKEWKLLSAQDKFFNQSVEKGESLLKVSDRMLEGIFQVVKEHPNKTIIIATHNMALNALSFTLRGHIENLSKEIKTPFPMTSLQNCDILMAELPEGEPVAKTQIKLHIKTQ